MVWGGQAPNRFRCQCSDGDELVCAGPMAQPVRRRLQRPRSSGDRASASGAEGRRFESCRGHQRFRRSEAVFEPYRPSSCIFRALLLPQVRLVEFTAGNSCQAVTGCQYLTHQQSIPGLCSQPGRLAVVSADNPESTMWFRADVPGLRPYDPANHSGMPLSGRRVVYATSRLDVARAFAASRGGWWVYEVRPIDPTGVFQYDDPDYPPESGAGCLAFDDASVVRAIDQAIQMTADDAWRFISQFFLWPDKSRMYDDDGYPTASPEMRAASRGAEELRPLGQYPKPDAVISFIRQLMSREE